MWATQDEWIAHGGRDERTGLVGVLDAEGVENWVVLHGGPTAVFRTEARRCGEARGRHRRIPGLDGTRAQLTIVSGRLTVRLTREVWGLEPEHVDLARAVSQVARSLGAVADRSEVQEAGLPSPRSQTRSTRLLASRAGIRADGRRQRHRPARARLHGLDAGARSGGAPRHAMQWMSVAREHAEARLAAAVAAGGVVVDAPTRLPRGSSRTGRATKCASPRGQTAPRIHRTLERPDPAASTADRATGPRLGPWPDTDSAVALDREAPPGEHEVEGRVDDDGAARVDPGTAAARARGRSTR